MKYVSFQSPEVPSNRTNHILKLGYRLRHNELRTILADDFLLDYSLY